MEVDLRRQELGKFFLDLSKYVLTVIVIGSLASAAIDLRVLLIGLGTGGTFAFIGYWTLPPRPKDEEGTTT